MRYSTLIATISALVIAAVGTFITSDVTALERRFNTDSINAYNPGRGSCGMVNTDNDPVIEISREQWDNGAHCSRPVVINAYGKTAFGMVVGECPSCGLGSIVISPLLFRQLQPTNFGVDLYTYEGSWDFV